jgi:hypothetical protein
MLRDTRFCWLHSQQFWLAHLYAPPGENSYNEKNEHV